MARSSLKIKLDKRRKFKFKYCNLKSGTGLFHKCQLKHSYCCTRGFLRSKKIVKRLSIRDKLRHSPRNTKHRLRLLSIAQRLTRKDVQCILFVAGDTIPKKIAKKVHSGLELFQQLEWHNLLCLKKPSQLKEWLQSIGRHDLASKLPGIWHGNCKDLSLSCDETPLRRKLVDVHRFLLLRISNCLSNNEIQQLLFLCPSIPECSSEEIKDGFKLFHELENQEVLGPQNYGYLVQRLEHIGRIDLAKFLVMEKGLVPDTPSSLKSPNQTLDHILHVKQTQYTSYRRELSTLMANDYEWEAMIKTTWDKMKQIFAMDTPVICQCPYLQDQIATGITAIDSQLISLTLRNISTFAEWYHAHIKVRAESKSYNAEMVKPFVEKCLDSFTQFNEALMPTLWNVSSRQRIQELQAERKDPVGIPANSACRCITDVCKGLMDSDRLESITAEASRKLQTIESITYSAWAYVPMLQWLAKLVYLARCCRFDITKHFHDLVGVVLAHKNHIRQSYRMLVDILGKEIMKTVDLLLHNTPFLAYQPSHRDSTSYDHPNTVLTPFYTFIISLLAQACGFPVDYPEVGRKLIHTLYSEKIYNCQVQCSIVAVRKMAHAMCTEVENMKISIKQACHSFAQRAVIEKLFNP